MVAALSKRTRRVLIVSAFLSLLLTQSRVSLAASDPERQWFSFETAHFVIHGYDDGLIFARRVAAYAEEAYRLINPLLGWTPQERVHIRVLDDVDASNGYASVSPYDGITILAHPPPMGSDLAYADDWLRLLVFHEYSHIVHLDNASGVPEVFNTIFGKVLKPNESLPRWFTEGVATWVESHMTYGGRVGSPRYEMILRSAALAGRLPTLDALTGAPLELPRAMSWYLYGSTLIDHVVRHAGVAALRNYLRAYGRRLIPYAMNTLARQHTGHDLLTWWHATLAEVQERAERVAERVRTAGVREGKRLTHSGEYKSHPRFTRDGRQVLYVRADGQSDARLVMAPIHALDEPKTLAHCDGGCGRYALSRDGQRAILSTARPHRRVNSYRDLVEITLTQETPRGSGRRLTHGARLSDPAFAARGNALWTVANRWGETWLATVDAVTGDISEAWRPPAYARIDRPIPHPDGRRVFASMHHDSNRDLIEVDLRDKHWRRLTYGQTSERDMVLTRDGQWLVYVSELGGIANVYARDVSGIPSREGRVFRLTNLIGGASNPCVSPDGETLVYVGWTVQGEELFAMPFEPEQGEPFAAGDTQAPRPRVAPPDVVMGPPERYSPLSTILPRTWLPNMAYDTTGLTHLALRLRGIDITRRLAASLGVQWDLAHGDVSVAGSLSYGYGEADFDLTLGRYTHHLDAHYDDRPQRYRQEVLHGRLGVSVGMPDPVAPMRLSAHVAAEAYRGMNESEVVYRPDASSPSVPREGVRTSFGLAWSFDTTRRDALSISKARGAEGALALRFSLRELGADRTTFELTYRLRHYLSMPWLETHVLSLGVQGGFAGGPGPDTERFDVGGVPRQDIVSDLLRQTHAGPVWLRGFAERAFSGPWYHLGTVEYRFPLFRWRRGLDTLPVFARDVSAALFSDIALVAPEQGVRVSNQDVHAGVGAELRLTTDLLFGFSARFRLGYAYGIGAEGVHHVYVLLAPDP